METGRLIRYLAPPDRYGSERRHELVTDFVERFVSCGRGRQSPHDRVPDRAIVGAVQHDPIHESIGRTPQHRIQKRGSDPDGEQHPRDADAQRVGISADDGRNERHVRRHDNGDERQHRQRALEKEIGQRESKVLVENDQHEREGRMVTDELHHP